MEMMVPQKESLDLHGGRRQIYANDLFFWGGLFFILGAISGVVRVSPLLPLLFLLIVFPFCFFYKIQPVLAIAFALFFFAGTVYYSADDFEYHKTIDSLAAVTGLEGVVVSEPRYRTNDQVLLIEARNTYTFDGHLSQFGPYRARFLVYLDPYAHISYGDIVRVRGNPVLSGKDSYGAYLAKEHIHGSIFYPDVEIIGNEARPFFEKLYSVRGYSKNALSELFTAQEASFLSGILFGDREEFSKEFLNKLSFSGTLHLTALSGSNMTIIVFSALVFFGVFFGGKRRLTFLATFFMVALFVAMTGFQVSAIRASIMAFIAGLAKEAGRLYNPRNALLLAALVITAWNPKAPVFDLAFQLSFLATLSIVYFAPALARLPFFGAGGFLGWRDILCITVAAQLAVAPITIANFSNFSFSAIPANVMIIMIMPPLMILGFLTIATMAAFAPLAILFSKLTAFLLNYITFVIDVFYELRVPFNPDMNIVAITLYYAVLVCVTARFSPAMKNFF